MLLKWAGGKSWLTKNYSYIFHSKESLKKSLEGNKSIQFNNYIEPFLGSGAIFKYLKPKNGSILSDINSELICFYNCLKLDPEKLHYITAMHMQKHSKDYYYKIRANHLLEDNIERAARFLYLNRTCYNGIYRVNSKGEFNVPYASYKNPSFVNADKLRAVSKSLQGVTILCQNYDKNTFSSDSCFVYFDPPYRPLTTSSSFTAYSKSGFNDNDQIKLADYVKLISNKTNFMLSNSDPNNNGTVDDFFDVLYSDFTITRIMAPRAINSDGEGRGKISEILVTNY